MAVRWKWLDTILGRSPMQPSTALQRTNPQLKAITSPMYERHVHPVIDLEEAAKKISKGPRNLSLAWDDTESLGIPTDARRQGLLSDRERKETLYKAYCSNTWINACVNVIAKRITSGGWEIEPVEQGKGDESERDRLKQLLLYVNDDEDFLQFLRAVATDLLIFGEAYCEIVAGPDGLPAQLHKIDCITMSYRLDQHGQVIGYSQSMDKSTQSIELEPDQVIRWWLPDPRASKKALSPIEHVKDAVYLYQAMSTWSIKFFKQGAKPGFSVEMGPDSNLDDAQRFIKFFKENYTGVQNAHVPPVMYNGSKIVEFGHGSIDVDFMQGLNMMRTEILAGFGVPPALVGVIESGNIGGGTGESQEKSFQYNTVDPIKQLLLEKLNYRILKASGITDWIISTRYANFMSETIITDIHDKQVRNGTLTINEVRQAGGKPSLEGGDEAVIIASKSIEPVSRLTSLGDEEAQQTQTSIQMAQLQLQKAKEQPAQPSPQTPGPQNKSPQPSPDAQEPQESVRLVTEDRDGEEEDD